MKLIGHLLTFSICLVSLECLAAPQAKPVEKAVSAPETTEITIDAVVATVNEKPILLRDLCRRLSPPRELSLDQASHDPEARQVLDGLILERLIEEEAASKKLGVSEGEIEDYITEVAARNNLDKAAFESALANEGKTLDEYKRQVRIDILKTKLVSSTVRGGVSVSEDEINRYLAEHEELSQAGVKLKLRQILIRTDKHSPEEAQEIIDKILAELEDGEDFKKLAETYSESPEASEGGSLGVVAEKDLSSDIFDAVFGLEPGKVSRVVKTNLGLHLFIIEDKIDTSSESDDSEEAQEKLREEARQVLMEKKSQEKASSYFSTELYKNHSVDKKI